MSSADERSSVERVRVSVVEGSNAEPDPSRYRMVDPYELDACQRRERGRRAITAVAAVVIVVLVGIWAVPPIYDGLRAPEIATYGSTPIHVSGLGEQPFDIDAAELAKLPCVSKTYTGQGQASSTTTVEAYGPTLATFLEGYGAAPTDFGRIVVFCSDGYTVVLTGDMLEEEVVMSIASGKDPLPDWQQPMRLVIPSEQSGNWAYGVQSLVFE